LAYEKELVPPFPGELVGVNDLKAEFEKLIYMACKKKTPFISVLIGLPRSGKTHFLTYYYWKINEGKFGDFAAVYSTASLNTRDMGEKFISECKAALNVFKPEQTSFWPKMRPSVDYAQLYDNLRKTVDYVKNCGITNILWLIDDFNVVYGHVGWKTRIFLSRFNELLEQMKMLNVSLLIASTPGTWEGIIKASPVGRKIDKVLHITKGI